MSSNHRFVKFWPQDWQRDPALRSCGIAARGLWIDLLCIMHEGEPYGHLTVNGRAMTVRQVGTISGIGEKEAGKLLAELEEAGVFSRSEEGVIYSRRMVRDGGMSRAGREEIAKRWGESDGRSRAQRVSAARKKGTHTPEEWIAMCEVFQFKCVKCGRNDDTVKDHILPIYLGGSDGLENLQPLCRTCNQAKGRDSTDHRTLAVPDWINALDTRLKRLGTLGVTERMTTTQEARSKKQETPPLTPPRGAGRFRNGFLAVIAEEGMPSQPEEGQLRAVID